eukprot:scpid109024/ scgid11710/ 
MRHRLRLACMSQGFAEREACRLFNRGKSSTPRRPAVSCQCKSKGRWDNYKKLCRCFLAGESSCISARHKDTATCATQENHNQESHEGAGVWMTIGWKTDKIFLKAERHKKLPRERNDADLSEGVEAQESPMDGLS